MRARYVTKISPGLLAGVAAILTLILSTAESEGAKKRITTEGVTVDCTGQRTKKYTGKIQSVSPLRYTVTVMSLEPSNTSKRIFEVAGNCKITTVSKKQATMADLRLGDQIEIKYFAQKDGSEIACSITQVKQ
jgi:hypothetical protein